jgi:hypothetical protein
LFVSCFFLNNNVHLYYFVLNLKHLIQMKLSFICQLLSSSLEKVFNKNTVYSSFPCSAETDFQPNSLSVSPSRRTNIYCTENMLKIRDSNNIFNIHVRCSGYGVPAAYLPQAEHQPHLHHPHGQLHWDCC